MAEEEARPGCVADGEHVVLSGLDSTLTFMQVGVKRYGKMHRKRVSLAPFVGAPYGSSFELRSGSLHRVPTRVDFELEAGVPLGDAGHDNSGYIDDNTAQSVKSEDIASLRERGAGGDDIIAALVAGSATWSEKSEFAQRKWMKRKRAKHVRQLTMWRASAALLCEAMMLKGKSGYLRWDSLAYMLSMASFGAGSRVMCADDISGLLTAAIAQRLDGAGVLFNVFATSQPSLEAVSRLNLREAAQRSILHTPLAMLRFLNGGGDETRTYLLPGSPQLSRFHPHMVDVETLLSEGVDAILTAVSAEPGSVLKHMLPLLRPGGTFTAFCAYCEPLARLQQALIRAGDFIELHVCEIWKRKQQVLPGRTHPEMNMSGASGYILCGTKVAKPLSRAAAAAAAAGAAAEEKAEEAGEEEEKREDGVEAAEEAEKRSGKRGSEELKSEGQPSTKRRRLDADDGAAAAAEVADGASGDGDAAAHGS